jgi:hypothetical protein
VSKLKSVPSYNNPSLNFIKNYTYTLGTEALVPFGAWQSYDAGQSTFVRYNKLFSKKGIPFVRASGSERVIQSATNWTAGFSFASQHKYNPPLSVILSESANDTLNRYCDAAGDSDQQEADWQAVWAPPIVKRLSAAAPGANLTESDIFSLVSLCAFDTVAFARASPWCAVFTPAEIAGFEYFGDVSKY